MRLGVTQIRSLSSAPRTGVHNVAQHLHLDLSRSRRISARRNHGVPRPKPSSACESEGNRVATSGPNAIKIKPQFYFNGILFTRDPRRRERRAVHHESRRLERDAAHEFDDSTDARPDLNPNGPSFIWVRRAPGQLAGEFYTQNLDGTNRKQLTNFGTAISYPRYSPDGSKIVFAKWFTTGPEIFVMNANGGNVKQLTSLQRRAGFRHGRRTDRRLRFRLKTTRPASTASGP